MHPPSAGGQTVKATYLGTISPRNGGFPDRVVGGGRTGSTFQSPGQSLEYPSGAKFHFWWHCTPSDGDVHFQGG